MLQRLLAFTALVATLSEAMQVHVRVVTHHKAHHALPHVEEMVKEASVASSSSGAADAEWAFTPVRSIQARVQGNAPSWDKKTKTWVASFGKTYEEQFRSVLDTVNTASVEGALMYVQAEGINVDEQSVKCQRKNNMQYVVFYDIAVVQPTASVAYYGGKHSTPEYCPFVAMDSGKCTEAGADFPDACKQFDGIGGQPDLGHCVGSNEQVSDKRAPYPGNYWFSYPNSCVTQGWSNKTDECREEFAGGLCAPGVQPDGVTCTYSYKILGYLNIDDLVGITDGSGTPDGVAYGNYTEFCNAGGVEFSAVNTGANGFKVEQSIAFWEKPGDETANSERTTKMIDLYNKLAPTATVGAMSALPEIDLLASKNPACYKNTPECASAAHGCRRVLYSQICEVCATKEADCVVAPAGYKFPTLEVPEVEESASDSGSDGSSDSESASASTSGSSTSGDVDLDGKNTPTPTTSAAVGSVLASTAAVAFTVIAAVLL